MKVQRFVASKVHGYLLFDISFYPDITFLTGINGSGKTTVVSSVSALISPSLGVLADMDYASMSVTLDQDGEELTITASKEDELLFLATSEQSEPLTVPILRKDPGMPPGRAAERQADYYREQEARNSTGPVLKRLKSLPTPMFLGLERRSSFFLPTDPYLTHSAQRRMHNVFSSSLTRSLLEAALLAERSYNVVQTKQREQMDRLKKEFVLSALEYEPARASRMPLPSLKPDAIAGMRATLTDLGLTPAEIDKHLGPFVQKFKDLSAYQPFDEDIGTVLGGKDRRKSEAYLEWYTNGPQFERLTTILKKVDTYVAAGERASRALTNYLDIVNGFLSDSGKKLSFDREGTLTVSIGGRGSRPITALSSGESQLVVILTHLAFNPAAQGPNVFIVDEPELSLHLRWQELFVAAVKKLNPALQSILATHSPAIILDDIEHCVDLSAPKK